MTKEPLYLTDITLHTRGYRQTGNFSTVADKGRMYFPLPKDSARKMKDVRVPADGSFSINIEFPPDLQERIDHDEVEIMVPESGLLIFAGQDILDFLTNKNHRERIQLIHRNRKNFWRSV